MGGKGKQVNKSANSLFEAAEIQLIDNLSVKKRLLNKSELHLNPVGTKVAVNSIWTIVSQCLAELCEV